MKLKAYRYVLIAIPCLIGFSLVFVAQNEAYILASMIDDPSWTVWMDEMRLRGIFQIMLTFIYCLILVGIAVLLYFGEFYFCKYIDSRKKG